jgi:FMN phosphatase YigB (HAD superfamily)
MKISSFDVFDTVLTRVVGDPKAVFLLLGKQLLAQSFVSCTPEAFAHARSRAESRSYRNIGEIYTLANIYTELAIALQLTDEQCEKIMHLELELESELIRPVPIAIKCIQAAHDQGDYVVFMSDMYLPAAFIQKQLVHHAFWQEGDELYVSNEYGKSKASGDLFRELIARKKIFPMNLFHWGNDLSVDVQGAKKVGVKAQHFKEGNLNRYEQLLESHSRATEGLASAMAGASRLARLQVPASNLHEQALRNVAAGVVAPTLVGYVLWVLLQAKKIRLKRLYFVSRDGQILLEVARRLIDKLDIDCELHYIYGSRLSWNLPALASLDEDQTEQMLKRSSWMLDTTSALSLRDFWARVNIAPEEIEDCLASLGFRKEDWERILSTYEQQALHPLLDIRKVKDLILQKAVQQYKILINYLNQEKLLDATPKGVVDLGWFGSSYDSLYPILKSQDATLDVGLFFGLRSNAKKNQSSSKKGYFFDDRLQIGFKWALPEMGIVPLEMFCAADHGTVVSFIEENGQARPVFREEHNQKVIDWGLQLVRDAVYCFTENLLLETSLVNPYADVREASADVLKSFWMTPYELEANAWGAFPWEKGHSEKTDSLAESYQWAHVAKSFLTAKLASHQSIWTEGAIARSSPLVCNAMQGFLHYRRLLLVIKSKIRQTFTI